MPAVFLSDRVTIEIKGQDALPFLNNLITTDLHALGIDEALPGALLTPQGKILFDFMIWRDHEDFVIETDVAQKDGLLKRLMMYRLRAAVELAPRGDEGVTVFWNREENGWRDMRFVKAGVSLVRRPGRHGSDEPDAYTALRISSGIALSGIDFPLQDAFPHDVMMDINGGVSFSKGCYVGQEVVSRMKHRGTARRRVVLVSSQAPLPAPGTTITAAGKPVGTLGSVSGTQGLSIMRIDRAGEALAAGVPLIAGPVEVGAALPQWAGLSFPASVGEAAP